MNPTPAELAAAIETVRKGDEKPDSVDPQEWYPACELLARWLAENAGRLRVVPDRGDLWSFLRDVLSQGAAIQMDYSAGKYGGYEAYSARVDAAARERADYIAAALSPAFPVKEGEK